MFALAYFFGIYSYLLFFLGLAGFLYRPLVVGITFIAVIVGCILIKKTFTWTLLTKKVKSLSTFSLICVGILLVQMAINIIGAMGPEIGFDALWYHLVFPKMYLTFHTLMHIPGGLLYYSDMPKLTEMLYAGMLSLGSDTWAKLLHFTFGVLSCIVLYKIARKYVSQNLAFLSVVIFYTNLVVGWESVSAYVDLARTFFEISAFWALLEWHDTKNKDFFIASAILLGLSISTKLVAFSSLIVYAVALIFIEKNHVSLSKRIHKAIVYVVVALLIPLPWLVFSFTHTGNPFYPIFSSPFSSNGWLHILNPFFLLPMVWVTFTHANDPISPIYIGCVPVCIAFWKRLKEYSLLFYFAIGFFVSWVFLPQSGEARFLMPFLPLFSLLVVILLSQLSSYTLKIPLLFFITITIVIALFYRAAANAKFIPVIVGHQSKIAFLSQHLNFSYGDFADIDGYFANHIKASDTVLLYGFHNLYYIDFPFIDSSWAQKGDAFDYVAVQGNGLPERFKYWNLVYFNNTTHVRLYSLKGYSWYY